MQTESLKCKYLIINNMSKDGIWEQEMVGMIFLPIFCPKYLKSTTILNLGKICYIYMDFYIQLGIPNNNIIVTFCFKKYKI